MIHTKRQSFAWPFCLSFACILSWFIPTEALFGVPLSADDGPVSLAQHEPAVNGRWLRQSSPHISRLRPSQIPLLNSRSRNGPGIAFL